MTQAAQELGFIEQMMYDAIRKATPEQQRELRALSRSQSPAEFTRTLQQRFSQQAEYITEERVKNVLAYDRQHQDQAPSAHQGQPIAAPTSAKSQSASPAPAPKGVREEMWLITMAKSKTMRFFAVSCEFIIFLGCLWLTLVTIMPEATGWLNGSIDKFFLIALGFAVDAALPEAWLHVVDQFTDTPRKTTQLKWSIPIALGMLLLVGANFVYAKLAGASGKEPTGALAVVVNTLLIARMFIGISYVTIRECQSFLDRKQGKQPPHNAPHLQLEAIEQRIAEASQELQTQLEQRVATFTAEWAQRLTEVQQHHRAAPEVDHQALLQAVTDSLVPQFQAKLQTVDQAIFRQGVLISEIANQAKQLPEKAVSTQAKQQPHQARREEHNVIRLVPANATREEVKAEAIRLHEVEGLSSYKIAEKLGKSAKTVQSWLSKEKEQAENGESQAAQ